MYVKIGPYHHWFTPALWLRRWFYWFNGVGHKEDLSELDAEEEVDIEKIDAINKRLKKSIIYRKLQQLENAIDRRSARKICVKIHNYDTWSADYTLAVIALPMLRQLHETKQGAPHVNDDDVPEELRSSAVPPVGEFETDANHFKRWDWVLDEIIWAFEQIVADDESYDAFFKESDPNDPAKSEFDRAGYVAYQARIDNALRLFGVHFRDLWD